MKNMKNTLKKRKKQIDGLSKILDLMEKVSASQGLVGAALSFASDGKMTVNGTIAEGIYRSVDKGDQINQYLKQMIQAIKELEEIERESRIPKNTT